MATTTDKYILELETAKAERGMDRTQKGFGGMLAGLGRLGPAAAAAGAALAGMAAVKGIGDKITEMDDLAKAARNVGAAASPEAFEGFQVARNLLGEMGLSAAESDRAFKNMTTRLAEAAETGKGPAADAFAKISESITDANGNLVDMPQLFEAVTGALQDGTLSMTDARKILGDVVGPKILGGFEDLASKGMSAADALEDVKANSDIISLDGANNAEAFGDTMGRIKEVLGQVGTTIVTALLPHLNNLAEGVLANLPAIVEGVKGAFSALEPVFSLIATVIQDLLWPALSLIFDILGAVASAVAPLVEAAIPGLVAIFEKLASVVQGVIDFFKSAIEVMTNIGAKVKMDIDVALGGMDQRKAHMFMRDVASKYGWPKATCLHTPIISSLKASGSRMESFDHKMSKSDPGGALLLHDTHEQIRKKMRKAYISPDDEQSPVYELAEHIVLAEFGEICVTPDPRFGEPSVWTSLDDFRAAVMDGSLHPLDAKFGVADGLAKGLESVHAHFSEHPDKLDIVTELMNS